MSRVEKNYRPIAGCARNATFGRMPGELGLPFCYEALCAAGGKIPKYFVTRYRGAMAVLVSRYKENERSGGWGRSRSRLRL